MDRNILKQGQSFTDTAGRTGIVNFNTKTGQRLNQGETTAISATDLAPVAPMVLPPTTTPNYGGLESEITSQIETSKNQSQQRVDNLKNEVNSSGQNYLSELLNSANISSSVSREDEDKAGKKLDEFTSQLEAEQLSNRRKIESLQKNNPDGLFGGGLQQEVERINRDSLSKQADIAILQAGAGREYDRAKAIADRQVDLKMEQSKVKLEALKFFYEENKADFNKADDRLYSEVIAKQEREYKKEEQVLNDIKNLKLLAVQNGADLTTLNNMSKATTLDEAIQAAGRYGTDPLDRAIKLAQLNKLNEKPSGGEAPTIKSINGKDMQWDGSKWVEPTGGQSSTSDAVSAINDKLNNIKSVLSNKAGLKSAVGTSFFGRDKIDFTGNKQNFIAGVQQLVSQDTLNTLINLKAQGGTLGALSDQERVMLQSAATKIGQWANTNSKGKVTSYNANEKDFITELNTIKMLTERAYDNATGGTESYLNSLDQALQTTMNPYTQAGYNLDY